MVFCNPDHSLDLSLSFIVTHFTHLVLALFNSGEFKILIINRYTLGYTYLQMTDCSADLAFVISRVFSPSLRTHKKQYQLSIHNISIDLVQPDFLKVD